MNMIRTIVIDDEPDGRSTLRNFLTKYCTDIELVGEAASVAEAVEQIRLNKPQLIFLDINMPDEDGFALFNHITSPNFHVIFVTAYDQYAVKAFKHNAINYILKPVNIDDLIDAVEKVKKMIETKLMAQQLDTLLRSVHKTHGVVNKIPLPVLDGFIYVNVDDIVRCEAEANYTCFYFTNRPKLVVSRTLGNYEKSLKDHGFMRIHHHHLINLSHVVQYLRGRGGIVIMSDKKHIDVSQRKRDDFLRIIEKE